MQKKILEISTQGIVFLFPIVAGTILSGASTAHGFLLALGLLFGWPAWQVLTRDEKQIFLGFVVFCAFAGLSLLYTEDIQNGIRRFERYGYFLLFAPLYLLLRRARTEMALPMLAGCVIAGFVMTGQGIYEIWIKGMSVAYGPYDKIVFGDIAAVAAVTAALGALLLPLTVSVRIAVLAGSLSALLASTFLAQQRGAWLFLAIAVPLVAWLYRKKMSNRVWISGILLIVLSAGALVIWPQNKVSEGLVNGFNDLKSYSADPHSTSSWGDRINTWKGATAIWQANPVLGTGIGDFMVDAEKVRASGMTTLVNVYGHAHSIFFDTLATLGLVGLITLLVCLFYLPFRFFYRAWKLSGDDAHLAFYSLAGMLAILAFGAFGFSEGWLSRNPMVKSYLVWLAVFMSSVAIRRQTIKAKNHLG